MVCGVRGRRAGTLAIGVAMCAGGLAPRRAAADDRRTVEVGAFAGLDYFGDDIELGNAWPSEQVPGTSPLFGARLGYTLLHDLAPSSNLDPSLGLEVEGKLATAFTGSDFDSAHDSYFAPVFGWRVHGILRLRAHTGLLQKLAPHVVLGVGGETVASTSPYMSKDTDAAMYWGAGASWRMSPSWALRLDLRDGFTAGRVDEVAQTFELHLGAETTFQVGGRHHVGAKDTDHDGIVDPVDDCPTEPESFNQWKDDDGCPDEPDHDLDGIADAIDQCPGDPESNNDIDDNDGCPELDPDGDGLVADRDKCPDQAEDLDGYQDDDGCRDDDDDQDGIADAEDQCPLVPETKNGFRDADGCPDEIPTELASFTGVIKGINFETDKARILPSSKPVLDAAVAVLREYPDITILIEGHTDDRGSRDHNMDLSQRRADSVKFYLVDKGIAEDRITTAGLGPDQPRNPAKTSAARAENRRIEFHITAGGTKIDTTAPTK